MSDDKPLGTRRQYPARAPPHGRSHPAAGAARRRSFVRTEVFMTDRIRPRPFRSRAGAIAAAFFAVAAAG
ncbi:hypothetical protein ACRUKS_31740, partial [Burkholderia pseudomallei]